MECGGTSCYFYKKCLRCLRGEENGKRGSRARRAFYRYFAAVAEHDGPHEGKSQAVAFGAVRGVSLIKLVKNMPLCFLRHSLAFVGNDDLRATGQGAQAHMHRSAGGD